MASCLVRCALFCVTLLLIAPVSGGGKKNKTKLKISKIEKQLLALINAERKKDDLKPLKPNPKLFVAARDHSKNMAKQQKLLHTIDGKTAFQRIKDTGYRYQYAGENIGYGKAPLSLVMKVWMKSKQHRENIMHKDFTDIGLGVAYTAKEVPYYTLVFASPLQ